MARNERSRGVWSQPPHTNVQNHANCSRGLGSANLDELGDIVNAFSCQNRVHKYDNWRVNRNVSSYGDFTQSECCLKNGLVRCHCLWPQTDVPEQQKRNPTIPKPFNCGSLPYIKKTSCSDNSSSKFSPDSRMPEEFILDDNELCLLNYYDIPINIPKRRHVRNTGQVKTVSIIDTLSELASGATDREDEGAFSSAVSESAVLDRYIHKPKSRNVRPTVTKVTKQNYGIKPSCTSVLNPTPISYSKNAVRKPLIPSVRCQTESFNTLLSQNLDDGNFSCNSLKRTLKYLRKAVVSNVVEEENHNKRHMKDKLEDDDAFRLCFSDSEVKDSSQQWTNLRHNRVEIDPRSKSKSLLTVTDPYVKQQFPRPPSLLHNKSKSSTPDWIQGVFAAANKGDVEKMKINLKDIDPALIRNLSDDHGNNLWHICAVQDNFECLNWLCSQNQHHVDALKDENKYGFTPVALAVKHGSLLAVQWLIHNTPSKSQLLAHHDSRSLLHIAARYGQYAVVEWLLSYMASQDLDANITDSEGNTALHLASKYGHVNCAKSLIFQVGGLKTKNECGLKPLDLAVKHCRNECADFLTAMESCYNLASLNIRQNVDIQHLQKENAEMKNYFKELLAFTKRLQHRQKELQQLLKNVGILQKDVGAIDKVKDKNCDCLEDYSHLLTSVMINEENKLFMLENNWKKSKKHLKLPDSKKKPLDILRSQFNHVLNKSNCHSPPIPSSSETSEDSEDEMPDSVSKPFPDFSAPDVVNSLFPQDSVPFLDTRRNIQNNSNSKSHNKTSEITNEEPTSTSNASSFKKMSSVGSKSMSTSRDVNLRMFFKQNPNLRQSSETCSVLEVLEPSSSDSEECSSLKSKLIKTPTSEKETELSSSSSAIETLSPCSGRPSSSGSKASGSHSSSNSSKLRPYSLPSGNVQSNANLSNSEKKKYKKDSGNELNDKHNKCTYEQSKINRISAEPDLIKGTQKKKMQSPFQTMDIERKISKENPADIAIDTPNISTDSESLEADRSFSSTIEAPALIPNNHISPEVSNSGATVKKKSFLFKFALRGKWQSKPSPRSSKKEISAEEFRETYSRSASVDSIPPTSQATTNADCPVRKNYPFLNNDLENFSTDIFNKETSIILERQSEVAGFTISSLSDQLTHSNLQSRKGLLPPRRDPPPAPPLNIRDDEQSQDHSDDDVSINIQKSSISSCAEGCITPSESPRNSYLNSRSSDIWHTSDSKSHFRPASSASRVDSPSRGVESYSLNKSCSASTEILSALDSSTAGRQSPAPSEVSKTESALSPPSDVSKTESTRYLSQLCKIEESGHLAVMKGANLQRNDEQNIKENAEKDVAVDLKPKKKSVKKNSNKPWYEFSDDEDVIVPQRYQAVSVNMRSSSEDEGAVTG